MKKYAVLGIAVLTVALAGCKGDDERMKEFTQQSEAVNRQIQSDCFAVASSAQAGGMFANPSSEQARAWRRDQKANEARQAALDQSPHCRDLKQQQVKLAGQIGELNSKMIGKELKQLNR